MRHTCDTARSGSERSENTCAACHEERRRSNVPQGYGDVMGEWERMTANIGRKDAKAGGRS
jgi:hypothetical protein